MIYLVRWSTQRSLPMNVKQVTTRKGETITVQSLGEGSSTVFLQKHTERIEASREAAILRRHYPEDKITVLERKA